MEGMGASDDLTVVLEKTFFYVLNLSMHPKKFKKYVCLFADKEIYDII